MLKKIISFLLSPTYFFADCRKLKVEKEEGKEAVTSLIKNYNQRYLITSIGLCAFLGLTYQWNEYPNNDYRTAYIIMIGFLIWLLPLSRCNEIFYAFIQDALDKVLHKPPTSNLSFSDRIRLALKSYLELIVNFAIIFYLLPCEWFNHHLENIINALYFSGVTITTLGYGDFSPSYWIPQLLAVYEVFCGFILLIVSFTIYVGRGLNNEKEKTKHT